MALCKHTSSPNYSLKALILNEFFDALELDRRISFNAWRLDSARQGLTDLSFDELLEIEQQLDTDVVRWNLLYQESLSKGYSPNAFPLEVRRLNNAFYARLKRLRKRVVSMMESYRCLWFATLTFDDDTLSKMGANMRRRHVKEFLNDYPEYIANIDFGKKNGREHYHAIIAGDSVINSNWTQYGFIHLEMINLDLEDDIVPVAKYVAKLSNHAVKITTNQNKIIYSRSKRNAK